MSSRPERTRISCHAALDEAACAPFHKEGRMKCTNATKVNRKSGVAEWRDLRFLPLLGGWTSDHLDEIVQPELAGEGGLYLIGVELKVLLCRHDWLIQGQTDYRPAQ